MSITHSPISHASYSLEVFVLWCYQIFDIM